MRIRLALPDISAAVKQMEALVATTLTVGAGKGANKARRVYQSAIRSAGRSRHAASLRSRAFPKGGKVSVTPSGYIYPAGRERTRGALEAILSGAEIRAKRSKFLAIPTEIALKALGRSGRAGVGGPREFTSKTGIQLQFIRPKGSRFGLLIAKDVRITRSGRIRLPKGGAFVKSGRYKSGIQSAVIFKLIPKATVKALINGQRLEQDAVIAFRDGVIAYIQTIDRRLRGTLKRP